MPPTRRTPIQHFGRRSRLSPKEQRNNFLLLSSPLTTQLAAAHASELQYLFNLAVTLPRSARPIILTCRSGARSIRTPATFSLWFHLRRRKKPISPSLITVLSGP